MDVVRRILAAGAAATILIAAAILIATRIASWRVMAGCLVGMVAMTLIFNAIPSDNPMFTMPFWWHLVLGGFAFGAVFMATDPVSAAMTETGKWVFGALIGVMVVLRPDTASLTWYLLLPVCAALGYATTAVTSKLFDVSVPSALINLYYTTAALLGSTFLVIATSGFTTIAEAVDCVKNRPNREN